MSRARMIRGRVDAHDPSISLTFLGIDRHRRARCC